MRIKSLMQGLSSALLALAVSACSEISFYEVNPPEDLQDRIDAANPPSSGDGDVEEIILVNTIVGADDCSAAWWTAFSDYFAIPAGKMLNVEFVNHSSGAGNWNNWNLVVTTPYERDAEGYSEYFVLRSDAYGWGNSDYNAAMIGHDYQDLDGDGDIWNDFRNVMQGASVLLQVDHSTTGNAFVTVRNTSADGTVTFTETYQQPVAATGDIWAFLVADGSYFEMKKAYLTPSEVTSIEDQEPVSVSVSGYPETIEVGDTDFWGEATAIVTFEDGSFQQIGYDDLSFNVPDLTTPGVKTIVYSYAKTKLGNPGTPVAGYYNIEVVNPAAEIEAHATAYIIGGAKYVTLSPANVVVNAVYADGSTMQLSTSQYSVDFKDGKVVYEGIPGTYEDAYTVSYQAAEGLVEIAGDLVIAESLLPAQTEIVGAEDFSSAWLTVFSNVWNVKPGESQSVSMTLSSDNLENWHSPSVQLIASDDTEYATVRMDNYGWGTGYDGIVTPVSDWNFDVFASQLDGSSVSVTVANNGDGKVSVRYYVISADGTPHYQYYDGIAVDASDLNFRIATEHASLKFD